MLTVQLMNLLWHITSLKQWRSSSQDLPSPPFCRGYFDLMNPFCGILRREETHIVGNIL